MDTQFNQFTCTHEQILTTCPDSLQFIENTSLMVLGCYELDKSNQQVKGQLQLYEEIQNKLIKIFNITSSGILDLKYIKTLNLVITCTVDSEILFYSIINNQLKLIKSININQSNQNEKNEQLKNLYISTYHAKEINKLIIFIGCDTGTVLHLELDDQTLEQLQITFIYPHQYSVWSTHISDSNIYWSGSDDQCLIQYDRRVHNMLVYKNKKTHQMGISFIMDDLITASYDQYIRFWDPRQLHYPMQEIKRSGGIWRIKKQRNQLLNALFSEQIYEIYDMDTQQVQQNLDGHESLTYGCDWDVQRKSIATLSFYDQKLRLWKQIEQ